VTKQKNEGHGLVLERVDALQMRQTRWKENQMLNQDLKFEDAPSHVQAAFLGKQAEKLLLSPGHQLYKFTEHPLGDKQRISPWWSSVLPIAPGDTGLESLLKRASTLSVSPNDFARARNAVTKQWNSMNGLLLVRLNAPAYAFIGRVAHQKVDNDGRFQNVDFIGGAYQLWIPNLQSQHLVQLPNASINALAMPNAPRPSPRVP